MADMYFKEHCPCGNSVDISGYRSEVQQQITAWRKVHTPHANAIAKGLAEAKTRPYSWPWKSTFTVPNMPGTFTFNSWLESTEEATPGG